MCDSFVSVLQVLNIQPELHIASGIVKLIHTSHWKAAVCEFSHMIAVESVCRYYVWISDTEIRYFACIRVYPCVWKCVPPSSVSPGGPVLHPDRQNTECLVIKDQRNAVRGSHNHRQTARGGMLVSVQTLQPCRVTLQLGEQNYTAIDG